MRVFSFLTAGLFSAAFSVSALSRVAEGAELYLSGDLRGSFVSPGLGGYLDGLPDPISGEGDDRDLVFGVALGIEQSLAAWELGGRSLKGWALRGEVEISPGRDYRMSTAGPLGSSSEVAVSLDARILLANFWLGFPLYRQLSGYAGFGVGATGARLDGAARGVPLGDYQGERREREFAFQVGAGLEYPVLDYVSVLMGYRYVDLGGFEVPLVGPVPTSGRIDFDLASHELLGGVRLSFDFLPSPFD